MKTLLRIDASARGACQDVASHRSISRQLANNFQELWQMKQLQGEVILRDVGREPPAFISEEWIAACFTPENNRTAQQQQALALSDRLIAEVAVADIILIASPMYNYGMPAALKAWFDQVIRINKTFSFDLARGDFPLEPTLSGKTLVLLTSSGEFGFQPGGIREHMDHLVSHIRTLSRYLGVDQVFNLQVEYQEFGDERHLKSKQAAFDSLHDLVSKVSGH